MIFMGRKRISLKKVKIPLKQGKPLIKWEVSGPGLKTRRFQLKSNAKEVYDAAIRVKRRRAQRRRRARK